MDKTENFRVWTRDWKDRLGSKQLVKMLHAVEEASGEEAQVSDDLCANGDDSITTCVWPVSIDMEDRSIPEDVCDVFGYCDKIHIDKDTGKLWFRFEEQNGLKTDKWLVQEDATVWVQGIVAADELESGNVHERERAEFEGLVAAAQALA